MGKIMSWVVVDVEADGPIPGDYSMVALGAIIADESLNRKFYARLRPISPKWMDEALRVCGFTRQETLTFNDPLLIMKSFAEWLNIEAGSHPFFLSDNNGFDWQFVNWYFHHFLGKNPFGHNSGNLLSLYQGLSKNIYSTFQHILKAKHDHNPVNDAASNAEALLEMKYQLGLKINL